MIKFSDAWPGIVCFVGVANWKPFKDASASNEIAWNCSVWSPFSWHSHLTPIFSVTQELALIIAGAVVQVCAYNVSQKQQGQCSTVFLGFVTFSRSSNWPSFKSNWLRRTGAVPKSRRGSWRKANFRTSKHGSTRALWPQGSVWFGGRSGEDQLGLKFTAIFYNVYIYIYNI